MLFYIWNWLTTPSPEITANNLLLSRCIRRRYLKQRTSILIIQKYARNYLANLEKEEDVFIKLAYLMMKERNKVLA